MAWNPNEEGNYAWLTKTASEHGGVDGFIDDIHEEGYQEGKENGIFIGASLATAAIGVLFGAYKGIKALVQKHKNKKQTINEKSESSKNALRQMYDTANDEDDYDYMSTQ